MATTYTPPDLPPYLANAFNLKPIIAVPTDDEVKLIHAVIRVVENASHIPTLFDPALSVALANHLFEVQMARYKSKYPFSIFSDITYTPPELPSHMNISLKAVVVAPSDDQIRMAQAALRFVESMASAPSMYDADLSMQLSQHLFDIQLARFVQRSAQVPHTPRTQAGAEVPNMLTNQERLPVLERPRPQAGAVPIAEEPLVPRDDRRNVQDPAPEEHLAADVQLLSPEIPNPHSNELLESGSARGSNDRNAGQAEIAELLLGIKETIQDLRRVVIVTHNSMARGLWNDHYDRHPSVVNSKGEDPASYGIKCPGYIQDSMDEANLARFLRYYGIGDEFLEGGPEFRLKLGAKDQALYALRCHFYCW